MRPCAAGANPSGKVGAHRVGDQKLGILGPSVVAFREANLLFPERLAVRRGRILPMR